jgi:glycosyltransferase involved in cell wall biosynthesis
MSDNAFVSVIIIFLNTEKYLGEAIESVISQTYEDWEIILVDDGSTDRSAEIAQHYARLRPGQIRYFYHPGHINLGKGASRNLGIQHAKGDYLAFLDADDVWLPQKLKEQVPVFDKHAEAGMVYGQTLYWYSWSQNPPDSQEDYVPWLGVPVDTPILPPVLLPLYLHGTASIPCPTSILVRRDVVYEVGGFDEEFVGINNIYEDQAFYAKLCLITPVVVINRCWDRYRQHPQASMAVAWKTGTEAQARAYFLTWLEKYLNEHAVQDRKVWLALKRELWLVQQPKWLPVKVAHGVRWIKKWLLRITEFILPASLSYRLWLRN